MGTIVVFGLGYTGSVAAACLASADRRVIGVDPDATKVELVKAGRSPVTEPDLERLLALGVANDWINATTSAQEALVDADVAVICVGTPSNPDGSVDLRFVDRAIAEIGASLSRSDRPLVVVVRSTVPPGTVEQRLAPALELESGRRIGTNVHLAVCPEFLREGSGVADWRDPPVIVVGAVDASAATLVASMFVDIDRPVVFTSVRVAEALKYACNAFHAVKVSFTNEIGRLCQVLGVDSRELMAVFCKDDRLNISTAYLRPGFAFGGSCLPKDLRAMQHAARQANIATPLLDGTSFTNELVVRDAARLLVDLPTREVALLGLSFKPATDDLRESPFVQLAEILIGKGIELRIHDPIVRPDDLVGANRRYVEAHLPHIHRLLKETPREALAGAGAAVVGSAVPTVISALVEIAPPVVIDLVGDLGVEVEALAGYRGICW
jgi:GDP-mannose 6-dehydrogenase